jgi:metabotropic X receptor
LVCINLLIYSIITIATIEFWEHHFTCKYPNSSRTPYNLDYKRFCTGNETLDKFNTIFEDQLQYVSDAVLSFAWAVR